jgi:hypothetical protein
VDSPKDPAAKPGSNGSGSAPDESDTSQMAAFASEPGADPVVWPDDPYSSEGSASEPEEVGGGTPHVTSPVVPAWPEAFGEPGIPAQTRPPEPQADNDDTAQFATSPTVPAWPEKTTPPPAVSKTTPPQPRPTPDTTKTVPPTPRTPTIPPVEASTPAAEAIAEPEARPEPKREPRHEPKSEPRPKVGYKTIGSPRDEDEPKPKAEAEGESEAEAEVEAPPPDPETLARQAAEAAAAARAFEESAIAAEAAAKAAAEQKAREEAEAAAKAEAEAKARAEAEAREREEAERRAKEEAEAVARAEAEAKKKAEEEAAAAAAEQEALRQRLKNREFPVQAVKPGEWPENPPIPSWAPQISTPPAPAAQAAEPTPNVPSWAPQSTTHGWTSQQSSIRSSPTWGTRSGSTSTPPAVTPHASEPPKPAPAPAAQAPAPAAPAASQPPRPAPVQPATPSALPVAASPQPAARPAWEIVQQKGDEVEPVYTGPSAEDRSYAEWFAWAKRSGAPAQACHAAAQGAFRALAAGQDMNTAVQWATLAMASPPGLVGANRQLYCAWFSLGNIDLKLPTQQAHSFATGAIKALDSGADSMVAHQAGLQAAGITG